MENLSICRICLTTDVRMCFITSHLQDMYERISSMTFKREDGRPLVACYLCHARLNNCYRLRTSCLQSEELLTMMNSGELKPQNVLSTNTFRVVSALHLSLGHMRQDSTECQVEEDDSEIIHDAELDQHSAEDIKTELQEKGDSQLNDNNQCIHLEDPLGAIKSELDNVGTDDEDIKLEIEDTILEKTEPNGAGSCSQLADNICPKVVKIVLQRIDVNDITTGSRDSKKNKVTALKDTEDATTNKRKTEVEKNEETENITNKKSKIVNKKTRVEKPTSKIVEKFDIKLNKCENVVTSIVNKVCEEKSTNNTSLEHNVSSISISKNKQFTCDTCKKCFGCKSQLENHIRTHTGEKPFVCNTCKTCFGYKSHLKRHIRTHTGEKPYICIVCKKGFIQNSSLKTHILTHSGEKPFVCNVCKKGFIKKSDLKRHILIHTGEKPFLCEVCKKCFIYKSNLKKHTRIHTGEKPFACNFCKKRFIYKSNLKKHTRIHTGEKPFACNFCKKRFICKSNLKTHTRIHTGEKLY